ncbi:hypothetical protein BDN70DRAFT_926233 [Pholiota conissans]|uniref:Uncharacterized protein n=1 Tax=Pholiota conissans TaxID=109636 RepID=A0A9P5YNT0_9AGAR|nr:hypothetical protein BDN70DRAFT_926233 [Pholiota conissans]
MDFYQRHDSSLPEDSGNLSITGGYYELLYSSPEVPIFDQTPHYLGIMQITTAFVTTFFLTTVSLATSATVTGFAGANCTGTEGQTFSVQPSECFTFENGAVKSISYSGVPNKIEFFIVTGAHSFCSTGATVFGSGSGCATAPDGDEWESVLVF